MSKSKLFFATIALMLGANIFLSNCTLQQKGNVGNLTNSKEKEKSTKDKVAYEIPKILPPLKELDVPFKSYKVETNRESKITIEETGTTINIPANAFVDKNGKAVSGPVEIKFREFHKAGDIILSGIPMEDPVTGKHMESAGMFEIRGKANGEEIFINAEKNIEVKLASYNEGNHFDFFQFDETSGRWETLKKNIEPEINLVKVEKLKALDCNKPQKPIKPVKRGTNKNLVFELNFNYKAYPELEMFKDIIWQFAGKSGDADSPEKIEAFDSKWISMDLKKSDGHYDLTLKSKDKTIKTRVVPMLGDKDYELALEAFDKKLKDFEKVKDVYNRRMEMAQQNSELVRVSLINGFGVYNHDCWRENVSTLQLTVDLDSQYDYLEKMNLTYFLISRNNNAVVRYNGLNHFRYTKGTKCKLVTVLPDKSVAVFSEKDFAKLESQNLENGAKKEIKMKTLDKKIEKPEDFKEIFAAM